MKVKDIENQLFQWAPKELAWEMDNIGLLIGNKEDEVRGILIALDVTSEVLDEAISKGYNVVVSHHPVMNCAWHPVQNVLADDRLGSIILKASNHHLNLIAMHTNLDAAEGGVNDELARVLNLKNISYLCEDKIGRIGTLNKEISLEEFLDSVLLCLRPNGLRYVDVGKRVHKVAVGGGACGSYAQYAIEHDCDTFVTSDLKYNDFLDNQQLNIIDAGHFPTENVICPKIKEYLLSKFNDASIEISEVHHEVIQYR